MRSAYFQILTLILSIILSTWAGAFQNNQPAEIVIGQVDMTHNGPNQVDSWQNPVPPTASTLYWPGQLQVCDEKLYVADYHNNRVLIYDSVPGSNNQPAAVVVGQPDMVSNDRNQQPSGTGPWLPSANTLHWPDGVQVYGPKLLIADTYNNRTVIFNSIPTTNNVNADLPVSQLSLYDDYFPNWNPQSLPAENTSWEPRNICINDGKMYIADRFNNRVLIYDEIPTEIAAGADVVVGQEDMWSNQSNQGYGSAMADTLFEPTGVFVIDSKLFITDTGNNRILIYNEIPNGSGDAADIVVGQLDAFSNQSNQGMGIPMANTLSRPFGNVTSDGTNLIVPDSDNHRILIYNNIPTSNGASADLVLGQENMTSRLINGIDPETVDPLNPPPPTSRTLYWPNSVFFNGTALLVADTNNNRVLIYRAWTPTPTPEGYKTPTPTPTLTPTPSTTPTESPTPSVTATVTPSLTPTLTPEDYKTPTPTPTASASPTFTPTSTKTASPSPTISPSITPYPSKTPSTTPTQTLSPTPTITLTPTTTPTGTPTPTGSPTASTSCSPTPTNIPPPLRRTRGDYNGDGTSDVAVYRSASGLWAIRGISRIYFGGEGDSPVPRDYDGDMTTDIGIFRSSVGLWAIRDVTRIYFGKSVDEPVPGDFNGDGSCDTGVFRPSVGLWAIRNVTRAYFGGDNDLPIPGDYEGSGTTSIALFRSLNGLWAIRGWSRFYFGGGEDEPLSGDFNGNEAQDAGIFRFSTGLWAIRGFTRLYFGGGDDVPIPADFSGSGSDGIAVFRSVSGLWALRGESRIYFGGSGDIPVVE